MFVGNCRPVPRLSWQESSASSASTELLSATLLRQIWCASWQMPMSRSGGLRPKLRRLLLPSRAIRSRSVVICLSVCLSVCLLPAELQGDGFCICQYVCRPACLSARLTLQKSSCFCLIVFASACCCCQAGQQGAGACMFVC